MIILIKLLTIVLGLTVILKTFYDYKKRQDSLVTFLFWSVAWIVIMYAAIQPEKVYMLMQNYSKDNIGIGTFGGIAFVFLFFITYRVYIKANRLERKIQEIVMKQGLVDIDKD